ncbi:MAG: hypothetical protein ACFB16_18295 [Phormidesmis sp.]
MNANNQQSRDQWHWLKPVPLVHELALSDDRSMLFWVLENRLVRWHQPSQPGLFDG